MFRFLFLCALMAGFSMSSYAQQGKQYYELREYKVKEGADTESLDRYLSGALLPALNRMGIKTVGLFRTDEDSDSVSRFVLIPLAGAADVAAVAVKLAEDEEFAEAASSYLQTDPSSPVIDRLRSELLVAFDVQPQLNIPEICKTKASRIFELRTYESATELRGDLKVEMFNSGEVPIFLDCGIEPIFFGQAIVGERMPNLTYMTVYADEDAKVEAWKKFREHPDWKVLSGNKRYAKTVSKIAKWNLLPMEASQL